MPAPRFVDLIPKVVIAICVTFLFVLFCYACEAQRKAAIERMVGHEVSWSDFILSRN